MSIILCIDRERENERKKAAAKKEKERKKAAAKREKERKIAATEKRKQHRKGNKLGQLSNDEMRACLRIDVGRRDKTMEDR